MAYYLCDGDKLTKYSTYEEAETAGEEAISNLQDQCDPEWPLSIDSVAIYEAPDDCELPDEDGTCVARAEECNEREAPEGDVVHYYCDYRMVRALSEAEG